MRKPIGYKPSHLFPLEPRVMLDAAAVAAATGAEAGPDDGPTTAQVTELNTPAPVEVRAQDQTTRASDQNVDPQQPNETHPGQATNIIFIDTRVGDYQQLIASVNGNADIHLLSSDSSGAEQIANTLAGYQDGSVTALHIVTHGDAGLLQLGSDVITNDNIASYAEILAQWDAKLTGGADVLFYGCNVADGEAGEQFIESLQALLGLDIAASSDVTGAAALGGDWELEYQLGAVEASSAFSLNQLANFSHILNYDEENPDFDIAVNTNTVANEIIDIGQVGITQRFQDHSTDVAFGTQSEAYLVVWSIDASGTDRAIVGQFFDQDRNAATAQFVISDNNAVTNEDPSVAYDPFNDRFLVVWEQSSGMVSDIVGQYVNPDGTLFDPSSGSTGVQNFLVNNSVGFAAYDPDVEYGGNRFLVAWEQNDSSGGNFSVFAVEILANTTSLGTQTVVSTDAFFLGREFEAFNPDVAYDIDDDVFVIVWEGESFDFSSVDKFEIYAAVFNTNVIFNQVIGSAGPNGGFAFDASNPSVAYNSALEEFLVVWEADGLVNTQGNAINDQFAIFGQLFEADPSGVSEIGSNDFQISHADAAVGIPTADAYRPAVAYSAVLNQYVVVWDVGIFSSNGVGAAIYGQNLRADGVEINEFGVPGSSNDFQISDFTQINRASASAANLAYDPIDNEFLVIFEELVSFDSSSLKADYLIIPPNPVVELSIGDFMQAEGNSGTTPFIFNVNLSNVLSQNLTVNYMVSDGSAMISDNDYQAPATNSIIINSGDATGIIVVDVVGDTAIESDENFFVTITGASASGFNINITDAQGEGTIVNDDVLLPATVSVGDAMITEGDAGTSILLFPVTLTGTTLGAFTVTYATSDGSATSADGDYNAITMGTLNFSGTPNETQFIGVEINGDEKVELNETFIVNLLNTAGAINLSIADAQGVGTITNDDQATISIADVQALEGDAGFTPFVFTVTLDNAVDTGVTVSYNTSDGSATSVNDYNPITSSLLNFTGQAGETRTVIVNVMGDLMIEPDENFFVNLTSLDAVMRNVNFADNQGEGVILNDDVSVLSIGDVVQTELDTGLTAFEFTLNLTDPLMQDLRVNFTVNDGTALVADNDYQLPAANFVTINAGDTTGTISVNVVADTVVEFDENFFVNISLLQGIGSLPVEIVDAQGEGTILNDDRANITINDAMVTEGSSSGTTNLVFDVTLDQAVPFAFELSYVTMDGSASSASDYTGVSANSGFAGLAGEIQQIIVQVNQDTVVELNENIFVNLTSLVAQGIPDVTDFVVFADDQGEGLIKNDDVAQVTIDNVTMQEPSMGSIRFDFTVAVDQAVDTAFTVDFNSTDQTAEATSGDYNPGSGTLNFSGVAGEQLPVSIVVNADAVNENAETFLVSLMNVQASGRDVQVGDSGVGTILDNFVPAPDPDPGPVPVDDAIFLLRGDDPHILQIGFSGDPSESLGRFISLLTIDPAADLTQIFAQTTQTDVDGRLITFVTIQPNADLIQLLPTLLNTLNLEPFANPFGDGLDGVTVNVQDLLGLLQDAGLIGSDVTLSDGLNINESADNTPPPSPPAGGFQTFTEQLTVSRNQSLANSIEVLRAFDAVDVRAKVD